MPRMRKWPNNHMPITLCAAIVAKGVDPRSLEAATSRTERSQPPAPQGRRIASVERHGRVGRRSKAAARRQQQRTRNEEDTTRSTATQCTHAMDEHVDNPGEPYEQKEETDLRVSIVGNLDAEDENGQHPQSGHQHPERLRDSVVLHRTARSTAAVVD